MDGNEPSLEDLGLDVPAKISNKISIERLQRESEFEVAMARPTASNVPQSRNVALDVMAGLLSFVLPGAGHLVKGRIGVGLAWFMAAVLVGVLTVFVPPSVVLLIVVWVACIASAVIA